MAENLEIILYQKFNNFFDNVFFLNYQITIFI